VNPVTGVPTTAANPDGVPAAVQPGVAAQRRHRDLAIDDDQPQPGDVLCPFCGKGNPQARRFCRSCGESLADGQVVKIGMLRKVGNKVRGKPPAAGYRPPRRRSVRPLLLIIGVLSFVFLLFAAVPSLRAPVGDRYDRTKNAIQDRFGKPTPVIPKAARASSSAKDTDPTKLIDGANNTYWAPATESPAVGEWLELELQQPERVLELIITPGVAVDEKKFREQSRPNTLEVIAKDREGRETRKTIKVNDGSGPKNVTIKISNVYTIRLVIKAAYDPKPGRQVAFAEVEVVARNSSIPKPKTPTGVPTGTPSNLPDVPPGLQPQVPGRVVPPGVGVPRVGG